MPTLESDTLKSQYAERVTADLEQNTAEQERVRAEIASLQEQMSGLENDYELLVGMRTALGETGTVPAPRRTGNMRTALGETGTVPAPRRTGKKTAAKKTTVKRTAGRKRAQTKTVGAGEKASALSDLIHQHLSKQSEPLTAGEIAKALTAEHPQGNISDNLVRTTTERLVARSWVEGTKQCSTVYCTATKQGDSASTTASAAKESASASG